MLLVRSPHSVDKEACAGRKRQERRSERESIAGSGRTARSSVFFPPPTLPISSFADKSKSIHSPLVPMRTSMAGYEGGRY